MPREGWYLFQAPHGFRQPEGIFHHRGGDETSKNSLGISVAAKRSKHVFSSDFFYYAIKVELVELVEP
jgi:hypothetical protein